MCCGCNSSPARSCKTQLLSRQQEGTAEIAGSPSQQPTLKSPPPADPAGFEQPPRSPAGRLPRLPAARQPCCRSPPRWGRFPLCPPHLSLQSKSEAAFELSARSVPVFLSASLYMLPKMLCSGKQQKWANVIPCKEETNENSCSSVKVPAESTFSFLPKKKKKEHSG